MFASPSPFPYPLMKCSCSVMKWNRSFRKWMQFTIKQGVFYFFNFWHSGFQKLMQIVSFHLNSLIDGSPYRCRQCSLLWTLFGSFSHQALNSNTWPFLTQIQIPSWNNQMIQTMYHLWSESFFYIIYPYCRDSPYDFKFFILQDKKVAVKLNNW